MRKITSVILAIVLALSFFAFSASAANEVEPRAAWILCPQCDQQRATFVRHEDIVVNTYNVWFCDHVAWGQYHTHSVHRTCDVIRCQNCGIVEDFIEYPVYCNYDNERLDTE